jgi:hypothetical protein
MPLLELFVPPVGPTGVGGFETVIPPLAVTVAQEGMPVDVAVVRGEADPAVGAGAKVVVIVAGVSRLKAPMIAGMERPSRLQSNPTMRVLRAATFHLIETPCSKPLSLGADFRDTGRHE